MDDAHHHANGVHQVNVGADSSGSPNGWTLADFVKDSVPNRFLRCSMSRNVKDWMIDAQRVRHFVDCEWNVTTQDQANNDALDQEAPVNSSRVGQILFASGKRKTLLIEFTKVHFAQAFQRQFHQQPWSLIQNKTVYVEFVALRQDKQARDAFDAVRDFPRARALANFETRIPGLLVFKEFLTREQEQALVQFLDANDKQNWQTTIKARQVQHFGVAFDYSTQYCDFSRQTALPPVIHSLAESMPQHVMDVPDQITVNEYLPGQGIAAHVDTHSAFTNAIAIVNLANEIVMEFRHPDGRFEPVIMLPRSLVVMTNESRYEWTHAIPPRKFDVMDGQRIERKRRISITLRKIQNSPCNCEFPVQCDSQQVRQQQISQAESAAPTKVEQQYVHEFYEKVAGHFSATRYAPWPRIEQFLANHFEFGDWIADIGCGNGKYMKLIHPNDKLMIGGDRSAKLCGICNDFGLNVFVGDALRFPLRTGAFDGALSIAVLHHLSTLHHRLEAVKEVVRVLRIGGKGIIYAWAHEQTKDSKRQFDQARQDFMVPWNLDARYAKDATKNNPTGQSKAHDKEEVNPSPTPAMGASSTATTSSRHEECATKRKTSSSHVMVQRYCHMFKQGELEKLIEMAGNAVVLQSYYDESNWAVILQRVS